MNHRKKTQKVKVFPLRIVTSIVGKTTRIGSEKHGCFGNFDIRDIFYQTINIIEGAYAIDQGCTTYAPFVTN